MPPAVFWLQSPVSWPALLLFGLGLSLVGIAAIFVVQLRRQVQAAWAETGRIYQRSTARFSAVGDLLEDVLFETDATHTLTYTNRAFHDLTGFRQRDLQSGLTLGDILDLDDLNDLRRSGDVQERELQVCCRDGARVPATLRLSAIMEQDRVAGWRGLVEPLEGEEGVSSPTVESVLGDILRDFNDSPVADLHDTLNRGLAVIGHHLGADRCYHYVNSPEGDELHSFCQWYGAGVSPVSGDAVLPGLSSFEWTGERLRRDGALLVTDLNQLAKDEAPECERWRQQGVTSLMVVPIYHGGRLVGILGCEALGRVRHWGPRQRQLLEAMAQICQRLQSRQRSAARLHEANSRAENLAEMLPEPVAVADRDCEIVAWNAALASLSGIPADRVVGRPLISVLEDFVPGSGVWLEENRVCRGTGTEQTLSSEIYEVDGVFLQLSLRPLDHGENLLHVIDQTAVHREAEEIRDRNATLERAVADQEQQLQDAQDRLLASQKDAAVARMVSGLAHELNTPMGVGLTCASYIQDQTTELKRHYGDGLMSRSRFEEFLETSDEATRIIIDNLQRANDLVSGMRQAAADQHIERKRPVPLKNYLGDVLLSLGPRLRERHVEVAFRCPDDLTLMADPASLYRVLSNLVMNALQHAFEGMLVGRIQIDVRAQDNRVIMVFTDDGGGMTAEQQERIYEPFFTTSRGDGGMGLGLHIVFSLITRNLGGSIDCQSQVGQGTTFRIELPMEGQEGENHEHSEATA